VPTRGELMSTEATPEDDDDLMSDVHVMRVGLVHLLLLVSESNETITTHITHHVRPSG